MTRCFRCDRPSAQLVRFADLLDAIAPVCLACFAVAVREVDARHRQFRLLLDNGVTRERATEIMVRRARRGARR